MEARYIDHYSYIDSPIHRVGPHFKMAATIALIFLILLFPLRWEWFHAGVWIGLIVVGVLSRIPLVGLIKRLKWLWLAIVVLSLGRLWQPNGLYEFSSSVLKSSECLLTMSLLANTTRFVDILQVLTAIQTPKALVTTLSLMYRYLFVLTDEKNRMLRARKARSFQSGRWSAWKIQANIISHLFVRCVDRASRIHAAMCSRGWQ